MSDYMDTPHYRVNKFASTARVLHTQGRRLVAVVAGIPLDLDDLEAVIRESAERDAYAKRLAEALESVRESIATGLKFDGAKWLLFESGRDAFLSQIDAALATNPAWQTPIVDAQGDVIPGSNHAPAQGES